MLRTSSPERALATLQLLGDRAEDREALADWAVKKAAWYRKWGLIGWTAYTWLTGISLVVAIAVPFGLATILYLPKEPRHHGIDTCC